MRQRPGVFLRDERGGVLVEFALVVPLFILLFVAILEYAFAVYTVHVLTAAVREGGRAAAVRSTIVANDTAVRRVTVETFNRMLLVGDSLEASDVDVSTPVAPGYTITVAVPPDRYVYRPLTGLGAAVGLAGRSLARNATFRWERAPTP